LVFAYTSAILRASSPSPFLNSVWVESDALSPEYSDVGDRLLGNQPVHLVFGNTQILSHVIHQPEPPVGRIIVYVAAIIGFMRHGASP
jgi:hypothetical protein